MKIVSECDQSFEGDLQMVVTEISEKWTQVCC